MCSCYVRWSLACECAPVHQVFNAGVKVLGLENILGSLDASSLRGVVGFSSVASFLGAYGLADYAAANGFLDGFERDSLPVLSIGCPSVC